MSAKDTSRQPNKTQYDTVSTLVSPEGALEVLSQLEVRFLRDKSSHGVHQLLRQSALAILNAGVETDDARSTLERYPDFDIEVLQEDRGIRLKISNAPAHAFVDGKMIRGIREQLSSVLRDIVYIKVLRDISSSESAEHQTSAEQAINTPSARITNQVFGQLRNANLLVPSREPNMVVCWGGHSISRKEYDYSKSVGYRLGLREMDICTGCGPGAMKGPMKGANVAHAKQRYRHARYLGISEPGIIAAESPNPIVNQLVIMPDIEKRLEAFVRVGHSIIVFPGGVGTAEEILYLLGILLQPENRDIPFPVIFTGPESSAEYFNKIDEFIGETLGKEAQQRYQIIIDDPEAVAISMKQGIDEVRQFRREHQDAFYFNWRLVIPDDFQTPFVPTHEAMASLDLNTDQDKGTLAANLRRAFSGIVAGNVKAQGIEAIEKYGPFKLNAPEHVMKRLDALLTSFVEQQRMKLPGSRYVPCYTLG
ncbi:Pyrimidine/purine nucleotide 5'-monophosphate nucleosidase [Halomonadaceae bacterium LMG 33818]|uniref:nucleotide 5'-monophosphate nucleosidase PpnN n=1 Tax=Cernens ardua TaxID=3402176 RepID=UPI003EDCA4C5